MYHVTEFHKEDLFTLIYEGALLQEKAQKEIDETEKQTLESQSHYKISLALRDVCVDIVQFETGYAPVSKLAAEGHTDAAWLLVKKYGASVPELAMGLAVQGDVDAINALILQYQYIEGFNALLDKIVEGYLRGGHFDFLNSLNSVRYSDFILEHSIRKVLLKNNGFLFIPKEYARIALNRYNPAINEETLRIDEAIKYVEEKNWDAIDRLVKENKLDSFDFLRYIAHANPNLIEQFIELYASRNQNVENQFIYIMGTQGNIKCFNHFIEKIQDVNTSKVVSLLFYKGLMESGLKIEDSQLKEYLPHIILFSSYEEDIITKFSSIHTVCYYFHIVSNQILDNREDSLGRVYSIRNHFHHEDGAREEDEMSMEEVKNTIVSMTMHFAGLIIQHAFDWGTPIDSDAILLKALCLQTSDDEKQVFIQEMKEYVELDRFEKLIHCAKLIDFFMEKYHIKYHQALAWTQELPDIAKFLCGTKRIPKSILELIAPFMLEHAGESVMKNALLGLSKNIKKHIYASCKNTLFQPVSGHKQSQIQCHLSPSNPTLTG
ncbi:MAG: hypothetical protein SFW66_01380 [Gammaproteobacteria bacterium]|nr:hypothetical protein [Gammaproteobacteria bacterium]